MTENAPEITSQAMKRGQPLYDKNPTIPATNQITKSKRTKLGTDRRGLVIDEASGEVLGHGGAMFYEFEEVDKERFVKLFLAGVKQAVGMSKAGMALFELVYDQMRDNKDRDFVLLAPRTAPMGERGFHRGLKELLERQFLFRSPNPGLYWVNIQFMFNGDRLAFVKGYKLKGTPSGSQPELPLFDVDAEARDVADQLGAAE